MSGTNWNTNLYLKFYFKIIEIIILKCRHSLWMLCDATHEIKKKIQSISHSHQINITLLCEKYHIIPRKISHYYKKEITLFREKYRFIARKNITLFREKYHITKWKYHVIMRKMLLHENVTSLWEKYHVIMWKISHYYMKISHYYEKNVLCGQITFFLRKRVTLFLQICYSDKMLCNYRKYHLQNKYVMKTT